MCLSFNRLNLFSSRLLSPVTKANESNRWSSLHLSRSTWKANWLTVRPMVYLLIVETALDNSTWSSHSFPGLNLVKGMSSPTTSASANLRDSVFCCLRYPLRSRGRSSVPPQHIQSFVMGAQLPFRRRSNALLRLRLRPTRLVSNEVNELPFTPKPSPLTTPMEEFLLLEGCVGEHARTREGMGSESRTATAFNGTECPCSTKGGNLKRGGNV